MICNYFISERMRNNIVLLLFIVVIVKTMFRI
jgi:hypothetical protein